MNADDTREVIFDEAGDTPTMVDRAEEVLRRQHAEYGLYQRGNMIVRIVPALAGHLPAYARVLSGSLVVTRATTTMLIDILTQAINWRRRTNKGEHRIDCPRRVAEMLLSRQGRWSLKRLAGVIHAPTVRPDGSVLMSPGYDEETGLYLDSRVEWPSVDEQPSKAQAQNAIKTLMEPLSEFRS
jgi:putative DNA primase/helicase